MTLIFNAGKLAKAAKDAVDRYDAARAQYASDLAEYRAADLEKWEIDNYEKVQAVRNYLSKCLKSRTAPRQSEIRELWGRDLYFYSVPSPNNSTLPQPSGYFNQHIETIRALAAFIADYPGDTITAAQLKLVGFDDLATLYRSAVG